MYIVDTKYGFTVHIQGHRVPGVPEFETREEAEEAMDEIREKWKGNYR